MCPAAGFELRGGQVVFNCNQKIWARSGCGREERV